jgi:uncharacterized protein YbbK (DUF523 family)
MNSLKVVALVLIVAGFPGLAYGGLPTPRKPARLRLAPSKYQ